MFPVEGEQDAAAKFTEDAVALVRFDAEIDGVGDFASGDAIDAGNVRIGEQYVFESFIRADFGGELLEQRQDAVGVFVGAYGEGEGGYGEVAGHVAHGGDLAVGHDVERAVAVAELGAAKGEVLDGALKAGDLHGIADAELVLEEDEDAVQHVLEERLGAKADAETDDAGGGDEGAEREVDGPQDFDEEVETEEAIGAGADNASDGAELGGAATVADEGIGAAAKAMGEEEDEALGDEGYDKRDEDLGKALLDEVEEVGMPAVLDGAQGVFFLWHDGGEGHDGGVLE